MTDIAKEIADLANKTPELREVWRRIYRAEPPAGISRDLLIRASAYQIQEEGLGGLGGVTFAAQLAGSLMGAMYAFAGGLIVYTVVDLVFGLRLSPDDERRGADLSIHKISANPEADIIG